MSARVSELLAQGPVPIVVSVGFAGSRHLLPTPEAPSAERRDQFASALEIKLEQILASLPHELGLGNAHVLCGISQIAIGADSIFTRACAALGWVQRIYLPQTRDAYLHARSAAEESDFTAEERAQAECLLALPHIIEERVVSDAIERDERFSDTNLEIIRDSDVFVCLLREHAPSASGGTIEFLEKAKKLGHPVLELRFVDVGGVPELTQARHNWPGQADVQWSPPRLPHELQITRVERAFMQAQKVDIFSQADATLQQLSRVGDDEAVLQRRLFRVAALYIIAAHLSATVCAVLLVLQVPLPLRVEALLGLETLLLGSGLSMHMWLHRSRAVHSWATFRLASELALSVRAMRSLRVSLDQLFTLPFPSALLPLLKTMHLLHLVIARHATGSWTHARTQYIAERLEGTRGQLGYYTRELTRAQRRLALANRWFLVATATALATTPVKLWLLPWLLGATPAPGGTDAVLSLVSILFPMLAVAALSLAASFDLEARVHTYAETLHDLSALRDAMLQADNAREFTKLALRSERELLAETANWASRRSFTSVA